jgi:aerobic-type carbon monoxide dehydrogenase small subunit (CoxS/CutS family)
VCREHAQTLPHIEGLYHDEKGVQKALVVADALYCGVCRPQEDPIEVPQLK